MSTTGFSPRFPKRVAYVVSHSLPYSSNGYAVRTHEVARALNRRGHDMIVFNRPGRPWDIEGFPAHKSVSSEQVIDGVRYIFLPVETEPDARQSLRMREAEQVLLEAFSMFKPAMVLAGSNWENAEPALLAARKYGCAFFYEQRGFWEMSHATTRGPDADCDQARRAREREIRVAKSASAVFTLNDAMRQKLLHSGVPAGKIHLVPNGAAMAVSPARTLSRDSIGCTARYLLGYVGSLSAYEGVEDILHVLAQLRQGGMDAAAMIVGSGAPKGLITSQNAEDPQKQKLRALAQRLSLTAHVHFIPQVPMDQTDAYYQMADVILLPRRRTPVTALVPPLKPYSAAAYGVPVLMTDLPPLRDIARDIDASLFPEGDITALAGIVRQVLESGPAPRPGPLKPEVLWGNRVRRMSGILAAEARAVTREMQKAEPRGDGPLLVAARPRFDLHHVPQIALSQPDHSGAIVLIGPGKGLEGLNDQKLVRASRQTLFGALGTERPGVFMIDWAGIEVGPGEWDGLWSISNMRLNRQIMDACRIALDQGWRIRVLGPVHRSRAPLFQTVAQVVEIGGWAQRPKAPVIAERVP